MHIRFEGRCTSENAGTIRSRLLEALGAKDGAILDFSNVTEADMTFFLLVIAARRAFEKAGRPLSLAYGQGPAGEAFFRRAGLMRLDPSPGRGAA